jgi:hypothetical protein
MVVIEGPRFSTRAESRWYAAQGGTLINMTGAPEAALARELRVCYAALALVTDMDAGAEEGSGVGQAEVFARFRDNLERLTGLLTAAVAVTYREYGTAVLGLLAVVGLVFPSALAMSGLIQFTAGWAHTELSAGPFLAVAPIALSAALELPVFPWVDRLAARRSPLVVAVLAGPPLAAATVLLALIVVFVAGYFWLVERRREAV